MPPKRRNSISVGRKNKGVAYKKGDYIEVSRSIVAVTTTCI
jgi:hypothetical protein